MNSISNLGQCDADLLDISTLTSQGQPHVRKHPEAVVEGGTLQSG
jgi:hypothetical protein